MRELLLVLLCLAMPALAAAQVNVDANILRLGSAPCTFSTGSGAPTGGSTCDNYLDTAAGDLYLKNTSGTWLKVVASWTAHAGLIGEGSGTAPVTLAGCTNGVWRWASSSVDPICDTSPLITAVTTNGGNASDSSYASQTTGWQVTGAGSADFRNLYVDQLHAKLFVADLEQALAGGERITKSLGIVYATFTTPANGCNLSTLTQTGGTATATCSAAHGLSTNDTVWVAGASPAGYNGNVTVTVTDSTHFTYGVSSSLTSPATGTITAQGSTTLDVEDLPGQAATAVFATNDFVVLRTFSRASGGLTIGNAIGQVVSGPSYLAGPPTHQQWTWARAIDALQGGSLARGQTIAPKATALDYGVSGNGYIESTVDDGTITVASITRSGTTATLTSNVAHGFQTGDVVYVSGATQTQYNGAVSITVTGSTTFTYTVSGSPATPATGTILINGTYGTNAPYTQFVTWATAPDSTHLTVRCRLGNLRGITSTLEYGLFCGNYAGNAFVRLSDQNAQIAGIKFSLFDSGTETIRLDPTVPSIALGNPLPSALMTGTGIWMGKSSGVYGLRVGNPATEYIEWDGTHVVVKSAYLTIDSTGITLPPANLSATNGYKFTVASGQAGMWLQDTVGTLRALAIYNIAPSGTQAQTFIQAIYNTGSGSYLGVHDFDGTFANTFIEAYGAELRAGSATVGFKYKFVADSTVYIQNDIATRLIFGANSVNVGWDGTQFFPFPDNTIHLGTGAHRWADVYAGNGTIQTSDAREKKNVKPITYGTSFLLALKPVDFEWINAAWGTGVRHGFLAQDVAAIDPKFGGLHFGADGVADGLTYTAFVPVLVQGFQELNARVAALEKKVGGAQ